VPIKIKGFLNAFRTRAEGQHNYKFSLVTRKTISFWISSLCYDNPHSGQKRFRSFFLFPKLSSSSFSFCVQNAHFLKQVGSNESLNRKQDRQTDRQTLLATILLLLLLLHELISLILLPPVYV
jgi:hypothetical protein